jgi:hypothetical protein
MDGILAKEKNGVGDDLKICRRFDVGKTSSGSAERRARFVDNANRGMIVSA